MEPSELLVGRGVKRGWPTPSAVSHCPRLTGTPVRQPSTWGSARSSWQSRIDFISCDVRTASSGLPARSQRGNAIFILVRCDLCARSIKAVSDAEGRSFSPLGSSLVLASLCDVCHHPARALLLLINHGYLQRCRAGCRAAGLGTAQKSWEQ